MKEWQKELYIYRLSPAPPKKDDLQEYIDLYLAEKDETYLSWFLHYYEPTLNTTVMGIVQRYSMFGHFLDIKEACVLGILRALEDYEKSQVQTAHIPRDCLQKRAILRRSGGEHLPQGSCEDERQTAKERYIPSIKHERRRIFATPFQYSL